MIQVQGDRGRAASHKLVSSELVPWLDLPAQLSSNRTAARFEQHEEDSYTVSCESHGSGCQHLGEEERGKKGQQFRNKTKLNLFVPIHDIGGGLRLLETDKYIYTLPGCPMPSRTYMYGAD